MRVPRFLDKRRRRLLSIGAASAVVVMAAFIGSALGVLGGSPSKFEAGDGNMVVDTLGNSDWKTVIDNDTVDPIPDATDNSDDSFVSGQKQDTECPGIDSSHGNPPKDDFSAVASFAETNNNPSGPGAGHTFLYGATVRDAANGNASENVELNKGENGECPDGSLARTVGDKLIAIDYTGGGTAVAFNVLTWIDGDDPDNPTCFVGNDLPPCWGAVQDTLSASTAEGRVNTSTITASNNPINGQQLVAGKFAEFGIDLTAADIVPVGDCTPFAQTVFESRASGSSFVSTTKDVAINDHSISNCGEIIIKKRTNPRGLNQVFSFTSGSATTLPLVPDTTAGGVVCPGNTDAGVQSDGSFCLNDSGNSTSDSTGNTVDETGLTAGTYTVAEGADPSGFAFDSVTCTDASGGTTTNGKTATIGLAPNDVVTCIYTNNQQLGAIKITKTGKTAATPLAGAHFSICTNATGTCVPAKTGSGDLVTAADGTVCIDGLPFGDYYVTETSPPPGYKKDDSTTHTVTVDTNTTCSTTPYVGESISFTDTPLTDITAHAESQAAGGTKSRISCVGPSPSTTDVGNSPQPPDSGSPPAPQFADPVTVTANGLSPGTYTCTIVIDP